MNHHARKTLSEQDLLEKVPVNPVKGFLEVELKKQALLLLRVELVDYLMEIQSSFV
jgi:hypothetical protein